MPEPLDQAGRRRSFRAPAIRLVAHVEPELHRRLLALRDRHGVTLAGVVTAVLEAGLPTVEGWPPPGGAGVDPQPPRP